MPKRSRRSKSTRKTQVVDHAKPTKKQLRRASFTHWCLTLNNPKDREWDRIYRVISQSGHGGPCSYAVLGEEVGEEGTPHFQIYIELYKKGRRSARPSVVPIVLPTLPGRDVPLYIPFSIYFLLDRVPILV